MSVNSLIIYLQINSLQLHYVAAFAVAASCSTLTNFPLTKFAVFERESFAPSPQRTPVSND